MAMQQSMILPISFQSGLSHWMELVLTAKNTSIGGVVLEKLNNAMTLMWLYVNNEPTEHQYDLKQEILLHNYGSDYSMVQQRK